MDSEFLVTDESLYRRISSEALYEDVFERIIFRFREQIFLDHFCFEFKETLRVPRENDVRADLILIDHGYGEWVLVEVEIATHSWNGHVRDQVERFELAEISRAEAQSLCNRVGTLDLSRTISLMTSTPPRILVICDGDPKWKENLHTVSAELLVIKPFRDELNRLVLQCNRQFRRRKRVGLSTLESANRMMPNWYKIVSPHSIGAQETEVQVVCDGRVFDGKIRPSGTSWYLVLPSSIQFNEGDSHIIMDAHENIIEVSGRLTE